MGRKNVAPEKPYYLEQVPETDDPFRNQRIEAPPKDCPKCGGVVRADGKTHTSWTPYRLTPGAPSVGCGNCGHIVYLTQAAAIRILT